MRRRRSPRSTGSAGWSRACSSLARADAAAARTEPVDVDAVLADRLAHWDGVERRGERGLRVRSSADRLGQIVDNLVANALAVSDDG